MARLLPKRIRRRAGAWGTVLLLYDVWRRVPAKQRRQLLGQARRHGPRLARWAVRGRRRRFF